MLSLLKSSLLTVFCASLVFILAGIGLQHMTEYDDFQVVAQRYSSVGSSSNIVEVAAFGVFVVVLLSGLPIVSTILQSALTSKRYHSLFLLTVPFLAFAVFLLTTKLLQAIFRPDLLASGWHLWLARSVFLGVLLAGVIVSTYAVCLVVARSEIPENLLRFTLLFSIPVVISMVVILGAMLVWGLSLRSSVPQLFNGNGGIIGASTAGTWLGMILVMAITIIIAIISLVRGLLTRSVQQSIVSSS